VHQVASLYRVREAVGLDLDLRVHEHRRIDLAFRLPEPVIESPVALLLAPAELRDEEPAVLLVVEGASRKIPCT
jgi:hypothetical protein